MTINKEFNPQLWYGERNLTYVPRHFIKAPTTITTESELWVITSLQGRYAIIDDIDFINLVMNSNKTIYFEDPKEAMMYELRWSGSK